MVFGKTAKCSSASEELVSNKKLMFRYLSNIQSKQIGSNPLPICISILLLTSVGLKSFTSYVPQNSTYFLESELAVSTRYVQCRFPAGSCVCTGRAGCLLARLVSLLSLLDPVCVSALVVQCVVHFYKPNRSTDDFRCSFFPHPK